jgi:hypothetical protein
MRFWRAGALRMRRVPARRKSAHCRESPSSNLLPRPISKWRISHIERRGREDRRARRALPTRWKATHARGTLPGGYFATKEGIWP